MRLPGLIFATLLVLALLLAACGPLPNRFDREDYNTSEGMFQAICIDGVEYWIRAASNKGYMAVRIDPETLQPRRCNKP